MYHDCDERPGQSEYGNRHQSIAPNSALMTINFVGTVYWKAVYAGDTNNGASSSCVALVVGKKQPSISIVVTPVISDACWIGDRLVDIDERERNRGRIGHIYSLFRQSVFSPSRSGRSEHRDGQ